MKDNQNYIISNLKKLLENREIAIEEFSTKLELEIEQVKKWFSCEDTIPLYLLPNISEILDVSYEMILNKPQKYSCIDESDFTDLDFKGFLDVDFTKETHIYRGQKNGFWPLMSSFCRSCRANRLKEEWKLFECKCCPVGSLVNNDIIDRIRKECSVHDQDGIFKNMDTIQILAYLQHNGVPTPLLDWTYSPYIALFFAIKDSEPRDKIALYDFNLSKYKKDFPEDFVKNGIIKVGNKPVTIIEFPSENINQLNQQGLFMYCNFYPNIEDYFQEIYEKDHEKKYLSKKVFSLSGIVKKKVMESFKRMNITERTLFPDSSHVAKDIVNNLFFDYLMNIIKVFKK